MNITYIHQHFKSPTESGGGRPYEFARRLSDAGHNVTMICGGTVSETFQVGGFTVNRIGVPYDNGMSTTQRIAAFARFMIRASLVAGKIRADVIVASSTPLTVIVPGFAAAFKNRARLVLEIRDLWPEAPIDLGALPRPLHFPARALEKFGYMVSDEIIALSPGMREGVLRVAPKANVSMIPNASDLLTCSPADRIAARDSFDIGHSEDVYVYAGSLGRIYDPLWLAQLGIELHQSGRRLIVAGDGALRAPAMDVVRKAGLDPDRIFIGSIPRERVRELLISADFAVSSVIDRPSLRHASINKIFDALGAGLPLIVNHHGWLSDVVCESGAGLHIDLPGEISETFDRHRREEMSAASRTLAMKFDREKLFMTFQQVVTGGAP